MTDHDTFLATIREHPADDGPRLMYANWLEDQGVSERAEFIRVQVELAQLMPQNTFAEAARMGVTPVAHQRLLGIDALRSREAELLSSTSSEPCPRCKGGGFEPLTLKETVDVVHMTPEERGRWLSKIPLACRQCKGKKVIPGQSNAVRWAGKLGGRDAEMIGPTSVPGRGGWHVVWSNGSESQPSPCARFSRGFPSAVSLSCAALVGEIMTDTNVVTGGTRRVGGVLDDLARSPCVVLESVELTDKRPNIALTPQGYAGWDREEQPNVGCALESCLPTVFYDLISSEVDFGTYTTIKWFPSASAAQSALSRACVRLVRERQLKAGQRDGVTV